MKGSSECIQSGIWHYEIPMGSTRETAQLGVAVEIVITNSINCMLRLIILLIELVMIIYLQTFNFNFWSEFQTIRDKYDLLSPLYKYLRLWPVAKDISVITSLNIWKISCIKISNNNILNKQINHIINIKEPVYTYCFINVVNSKHLYWIRNSNIKRIKFDYKRNSTNEIW
jgi:hypothetical protein